MSDETETSLREDLIAAFKESEAVEQPDTETQGAEPTAVAEADRTAQSETDQPSTDASENADEKKQATGEPPKADAKDGSKEPVEPPDRWTEEQKQEFAALDPAVQRLLLSRNKGLEASYTKKMMEVAQERQRFQGIEQALAPHRQSWSGTGWSDAQALQNIMGYWQHAQKDPLGFVQRFAEERGIDLASHFAPSTDEILAYLNASGGVDQEGNPLPVQQPAVHPDVRRQMQAYEQRINQLQQAVQQQQGYLSHAEQQRMAQERATAQRQLEEFVTATDENGRPKHEYYEELKPEMIRLMEAGISATLDEAYERALWSNPQMRQRQIESRESALRREQERREQQEAEKARRASASVVGSGVPAAPANDEEGDLSVRALLEREFRRSAQQSGGLI